MPTSASAKTTIDAPLRAPVVSVGHAARAATAWLTAEAGQRQARPWLGLVGVALGSTAVLLTNLPLLVPLLAVCAWWWCPRERFAWLIPIGAGILDSRLGDGRRWLDRAAAPIGSGPPLAFFRRRVRPVGDCPSNHHGGPTLITRSREAHGMKRRSCSQCRIGAEDSSLHAPKDRRPIAMRGKHIRTS